MARKTFNVADLKARINRRLELSTCAPEVRRGMASVLEEILHDSGNYKGFQLLESANGRYEQQGNERRYVADDDTRRYYI